MDRNVKQLTFTRELSFTRLTLQATWVGEDCHLLLWGGDKPHLGCTVLAVPRPSLSGEGQSATSSVLNLPGHKDEVLCRQLAEETAAASGCTTVCSGGVHVDNLTSGRIAEIQKAMDGLVKETVLRWENGK